MEKLIEKLSIVIRTIEFDDKLSTQDKKKQLF